MIRLGSRRKTGFGVSFASLLSTRLPDYRVLWTRFEMQWKSRYRYRHRSRDRRKWTRSTHTGTGIGSLSDECEHDCIASHRSNNDTSFINFEAEYTLGGRHYQNGIVIGNCQQKSRENKLQSLSDKRKSSLALAFAETGLHTKFILSLKFCLFIFSD